VVCQVTVGGSLRSRKGMNIPNVALGLHAFTEHDRELAAFALAEGVDALSQSFVDSAKDIEELREYTKGLGYSPFIIAKIERAGAVDNLQEILQAADGIMVARGDLGVEIPIARVPVVQKEIVRMANAAGKPVITATHMLESMIFNRLPTRAEATDVANAILDGTDCVMLSGESAIGSHPLAAVETLAAIATEAEKLHPPYREKAPVVPLDEEPDDLLEVIAAGVAKVIQQITPTAVVVPTRSGETARNITRYRVPVFIFGVSSRLQTCRELVFSYGVIPIHEPDHPTRWRPWIRELFKTYDLCGRRVVLTEGPSAKYPDRNDRLEIIDLQRN
jgi:pyruvate kinase